MKRHLVPFLAVLILLAACGDSGETRSSTPSKASTSSASASPGQRVYQNYCLQCHTVNGTGIENVFPTLVGSEETLGDPQRLALGVLTGYRQVDVEDYPSQMPEYQHLSNKQIADVLSYIRSRWGNDAPAVTPETVAQARAQISS